MEYQNMKRIYEYDQAESQRLADSDEMLEIKIKKAEDDERILKLYGCGPNINSRKADRILAQHKKLKNT